MRAVRDLVSSLIVVTIVLLLAFGFVKLTEALVVIATFRPMW